MAVALVGTLDTKGDEVQFVRDQLHALGVKTIAIDAGVQGSPKFFPDISRDEVFAAAGTTTEALQQAGDRGKAVESALADPQRPGDA